MNKKTLKRFGRALRRISRENAYSYGDPQARKDKAAFLGRVLRGCDPSDALMISAYAFDDGYKPTVWERAASRRYRNEF